ncbi:hypothetical protein ACFE04_025352 [Oxalis oulophora]
MTTALDDYDDLDRISKLPESILHHIQSFLTYKNNAQLSVLSKTWKQVSIYQPNLTFDYDFFRFHSCLTVYDQKMRGLNINKFKLDIFILDLDWLSYIDQWIQQAINRNVRELTLWFWWDYSLAYIHTLPVFILLAKSVVTLNLKRCKLPPVDRYFKTNLSSLKKVFLYEVELSDHLPQDIFTNVEDLTLSYCIGMHDLVEVKLTGEIRKGFDIKKCKHLRSISIIPVNITTDWLNEGLNYYPALKNLHLDIVQGNNNNNKVTISSCSLTFFKIKMSWYQPSILEINAPNLSEFTYFGHAPELSLNAPSLVSCSFDLGKSNEHITPEYSSHLKEIEFLSNFNHCRNVNLTCQNVKLLMVPKGVRDIRVSPLPNVEKLKITLYGDKTLEQNEELMDSLFWISPHSEFFKDETDSENEFVAIAHPAVSTDRIEENF